MNVVDIKKDNYRDVVTSIRRLAEEIEAGVHGKVETLVTVMQLEDRPDVEVFGWGRASDIECSALLAAGHLKILELIFGKESEET